MTTAPPKAAFEALRQGFDSTPQRSHSLAADAYTDPAWFAAEREAIFARSWRWVCHGETLRERGAYVATELAGRPILLVRGRDGTLRGFYNV